MSETLREVIAKTQEAFRADPEAARATFESVSLLTTGLRSEVKMRDHRLTVSARGGTGDERPTSVQK